METVCASEMPSCTVEVTVRVTCKQLAVFEEDVQLREQPDLRETDATDEMMRSKLTWMFKAGSCDHLGQSQQRVSVKVIYTLGFISDYERSLANKVLSLT